MNTHDITIKITHLGSVDVDIKHSTNSKSINIHIDDIDMIPDLAAEIQEFYKKIMSLVPDSASTTYVELTGNSSSSYDT